MALLQPRPDACASTPVAPELRVDLDAVARNTRHFVGHTRVPVMAVVKADGFGHGAVSVARTALTHGATWLGVTSLAEALELRHAGIAAPVLSWLNPVGTDFGPAAAHRIDVGVPGRDHLDAVAAAAAPGEPARLHLHVDTGMTRDGCGFDTWPELVRAARDLERRGLIEVVGVMGHLACADEPTHPANAAGKRAFDAATDLARAYGLRPRVIHLAATSATLTDRSTHHDLVRVGAGLYGIDPSGTTRLAGALTLVAPVVSVRTVGAGSAVGYGHTHRTARRTRLALLPLGYADGLPRAASGLAQVAIRGRRCRVVGRISMDQIVVDTGHLRVRPGDVATVFGPGRDGEPTVAEWAHWSGTIEHEIVTGIGARVRRTESAATPLLRSIL